MKKKLLILTTLVVICLVMGCVGEIKTYTDSGQTIEVGVDQEFVIAIGSNPTTGYSWQAGYDDTLLELVGGQSTYKLGEEAEKEVVGAGGVEYFLFKTLKKGEAEITLVYRRSWQDPTPDDITRVFPVSID